MFVAMQDLYISMLFFHRRNAYLRLASGPVFFGGNLMLRFTSVILFFAVAFTGAAHATPLTYSESTTASGSLGLQGFTNALVTISGTANTENVQNIGPDFFFINMPSAEVSVAGLGTFLFTDELDFFTNSVSNPFPEAAGVSDRTLDGFDILDTFSTGIGTYNLKSAFGPVTGMGATNLGTKFGTTDGDLVFSSIGDSTFTATSAVPEPTTIELLGTGILALATVARRKFADS
jgi:hypothetical protein